MLSLRPPEEISALNVLAGTRRRDRAQRQRRAGRRPARLQRRHPDGAPHRQVGAAAGAGARPAGVRRDQERFVRAQLGEPRCPISASASISTTRAGSGPGKVALLERIASEGSISAAGRSMNMSYKRAWELVAEINQQLRRAAGRRPDRRQGGRRRRADAARRGADPPLPRHRAQGAVGHRLPSQGAAGDFPQQATEITRYPRRTGRIRHGEDQKSARACRASRSPRPSSPRRARERFVDPAFESAAGRDRQDHRGRLGRLPRLPQGAAHEAGRARAIADPDYELSVDWLKRARCHRPRRAAAEVAGVDVAHPAGQRLVAQRPDLPRRDVQDLPAGRDRRAR